MEDEWSRCRSRGDIWLKVVLAITGLTALLLALSFSEPGAGPVSAEVGAPPAAPAPATVTFASSESSTAPAGGPSAAPGSAAPAGGPSAAPSSSERERSADDFVADVAGCRDLACLRAAHAAGRGGARFAFPHFFIVGWQKTATTSLWRYLKYHPDTVSSETKEPEFFTRKCNQDPAACPPEDEAQYLANTLAQPTAVERGLEVAAFEGSTHYARAGDAFPAKLQAALPWLKVVANMREPISRAISHVVHADEKGWGGVNCLADRGVFECVRKQLKETPQRSTGAPPPFRGYGNYSYPLSRWLEAFPRDQILVLQYEHLGSEKHQASELRRLKSFLGLDVEQGGETLEVANARKARAPAGWPMRREEYEALVELVRPDGKEVARLLGASGLGDGPRFLARWEAVWRQNLASCDGDGKCAIQVS